MRKIAFVVQRYGVEVNGGAEYYCRVLAERLTSTYEVDVLTSCALEYVTWANWYPAATTQINGVNVHRFPTHYERQAKDHLMYETERKIKKWSRPEEWHGMGWLRMWGRALVGKTVRRYMMRWAQYQGPYTPDLITFLKRNHQQYDALIFITYLYYPTIAGMSIAPQKSIFIPTAHDEIPIYLPGFRTLFHKPRAILFLTSAEKRFVNQLFKNEAIYNDVIGVGIEKIDVNPTNLPTTALTVEAPYLIYIGRIDKAKGCAELFDYFIQYKENHPSDLKLVLVGQAFMPIPDHPDLLLAGFVDEEVKIDLLKKAKALVIPSQHESLSMVTLESFAYGIPVLANKKCEVLEDHINLSRAGLLFSDYTSFADAVQQLLAQDSSEMSEKGQAYIEQNYTWDKVLAKFTKAVDYVAGNGRLLH
ncbi:glycosyltransferase family 4 protein [Spirosoma foliorum]|uniref:Glycosyltransferase family 4 protein n=1 Tax=Spirosoma foliorum TaxID=2710596 RepID=A0A7G5GRU7_9BACT|nr:glycosyltransferase family 4 protein [Spirosoma foliorum]QMW01589.1 glycosyltransferase family 4 protein [Spirosoma foliorum]